MKKVGMSSDHFVNPLGFDLFFTNLIINLNIFESSTLISKIFKRLEIFKVFRSEQSMIQLFVFAHLISVAQAPTLNTQVFAISSSKIDLEKLSVLSVFIRLLTWAYKSIFLVITRCALFP